MLKATPAAGVPRVRRTTPTRRKYPLDSMTIGEMFFVEGLTKNTLAPHICTMGKKLERTFNTRLCWMRKTRDGWVECAPTDTRAVQGVGVFRVA